MKNSTVALSTTLESYSETAGSVLSASSPVVAKGAENMYNVLLNYIYYKNTDGEDFDLAFAIGTDRKINVPLDATVTFEFADGESMALRNTADDVNFVRLSPATDQVRRLSYSPVKSIRITDENGETILEDSFSAKDNFHAAVRLQRELLLSASPR